MITIGSYTKEEIASELNIDAKKAVNITRKLDKLGYHFSTSGKGSTYRITITAVPGMTVKEFAKKYLGISAHEEKIEHFLHLLLNESDAANMTAGSLQWLTYSCDETINHWLKALIDCGLLINEPLGECYYATKKEYLEFDDESGDYTYTMLQKPISPTEYEQAMAAYNAAYKEFFEDIDNNPDMVEDEALYYASKAKKDAIGGWWPMRKNTGITSVNTAFPHYNELLELLKGKEFDDYAKVRSGNILKDQKAWEERVAAWEKEKADKRRRLEEAAIKKELAAAAKNSELVDLSDMPIFTNIFDAFKYIDDNYYGNKISLRREKNHE